MKARLLRRAILISFFSIIIWNANALIIYRPQNKDELNEVRCYIQILDEKGNDVTYSLAKASYAWIDQSEVLYSYEKSFYLMGGMAMHLGLPEGKYTITFSTPADKQYPYPRAKQLGSREWKSNSYTLNTANLPKVIFVSPVNNDNGFFDGEWHIDYRAPKFFKWTKGLIKSY